MTLIVSLPVEQAGEPGTPGGRDAAKLHNAVAVAETGREGEVRFFDEVDASPEVTDPACSPGFGGVPHPGSAAGQSSQLTEERRRSRLAGVKRAQLGNVGPLHCCRHLRQRHEGGYPLAPQGEENMNDRVEKTTWPDAAVILFDLLTGRKAEVTWEFERMEIHVPITTGSDTEYAIWKVNGVLKVRAREEAPT